MGYFKVRPVLYCCWMCVREQHLSGVLQGAASALLMLGVYQGAAP